MQSDTIQLQSLMGLGQTAVPDLSGKTQGGGDAFANLFQTMLSGQNSLMTSQQTGQSLLTRETGKMGNTSSPAALFSDSGRVQKQALPKKSSFYGLNQKHTHQNSTNNRTETTAGERSRGRTMETRSEAKTERPDAGLKKVQDFLKKAGELVKKNEIRDASQLREAMQEDPGMQEIMAGLSDEKAQELAEALMKSLTAMAGEEMAQEAIQPDQQPILPETETIEGAADESAASQTEETSADEQDGLERNATEVADEKLRKLLASLREQSDADSMWNTLDEDTALQVLRGVMAMSPDGTQETTQTSDAAGDYIAFGSRERSKLDGMKLDAELRKAAKETDGETTAADDQAAEGQEGSAKAADSEKASVRENRIDKAGKEQKNSQAQMTEQGRENTSQTSSTTVANQVTASVTQQGGEKNSSSVADLLSQQRQKADGIKTTGTERVIQAVTQEVGKNRREGQFGSNHSGMGNQFAGSQTRETQGQSRQANNADPVRSTVFSQLVEKAYLLKGPQMQKTLTIQLKPEFLGKVHLELTSKDGTVSARIMTENAQVKEKIEEIAPQIKSHLNEQGIHFENLTVDVSTQNPDGKGREGFSDRSSFGFGFSRKARAVDVTETVAELPDPVTQNDPYTTGVDITI